MAQSHPFWTSPDFWTIAGSVAAVMVAVAGFLRWFVSGIRKRSGRQPPRGPRRRWVRRGPVITNDRPALTSRFTGRNQVLVGLRGRLQRGRPVVLYGLGGVGKTQAVLAYVARHQRAYDIVWWVRAEQPSTLAGDYARLAYALGLPEHADPDQQVVVSAVRSWLSRHHRWLLVFDNATSDHTLLSLLPDPLGGQVLATSRSQLWPDADVVQVEPWSSAESLAFLDRSLNEASTDNPHSEQDRKALAAELGHLPIALDQAAAFLQNTGWPLARYLEQLRSEPGKLLDLRGLADDERTIAKTWMVALNRLREVRGAEELLTLCAFLAPDDLSRTLPIEGAEVLPDGLRQVVSEQVALERAVLALRRYSFVTATNKTLTVHRLVQAVVRDNLDADGWRVWAGAAVRLIAAAFPKGKLSDPAVWRQCASLLPHALAAANHAQHGEVEPAATSKLLNRAGSYLEARGWFSEAQQALERALALDEATFGPEDPTTANSLSNLGSVLRAQGDLPRARCLLERALAIREASFGADDPRTADSLDNLARVLREMADRSGARALLERALAIREAHLGADDPRTADSLNNLGIALLDLADLKGARGLFERALAIREASLDPNHPEIATSLNNVAEVLHAQGDHGRARSLYERALANYEASLGPDHPTTASTIFNLAAIIAEQGRLDDARVLHERAMAIYEARLGPDHPEIATSLTALAGILAKQGDLARACGDLQRALEISEAALGREHPSTRAVADELARLQDRQ
jgi:tetratricopeptide (TPR) repeat protein